MAVRRPVETEPRNKDIMENDDWDDIVEAKQMQNAKERAKKIDELASIGEKKPAEPEKKEKDEAGELKDFIEVIIKISK
jgi:hypothetical protein